MTLARHPAHPSQPKPVEEKGAKGRGRQPDPLEGTDHLFKDCRQRGGKSTGRPTQRGPSGPGTKAVTTRCQCNEREENPMDLLYSSDSDDQSARLISVQDKGSCPKYAHVTIGEPCLGIIDTGSDITIVGGDLFKKKDFRQPDKTPVTYNQQPFRLHGQMDLNITFGEKTMVTPVYIKMDAHDQLLLSKGVCRQLDIVRYHPEVDEVNGQKKEDSPVARVQLVQSFSLRPYQSAIVPVRATGVCGTHMLEPYQLGDSPLCVQESSWSLYGRVQLVC